MRSGKEQTGVPDRVLGLFAKWPALGAVKTALAGNDPAWGVRVARALPAGYV